MRRNPVIQEQKTGCAIASAAAIAGISYREAREVASRIGISAENPALWSDTAPIRRLLGELGIRTGGEEVPFKGWDSLPKCALLAIKWHLKNGIPYWHWVVFVRENAHSSYVLDSKKGLATPIRTDFGRMKPKWFIEVFC